MKDVGIILQISCLSCMGPYSDILLHTNLYLSTFKLKENIISTLITNIQINYLIIQLQSVLVQCREPGN